MEKLVITIRKSHLIFDKIIDLEKSIKSLKDFNLTYEIREVEK
jgi:hypothetical protein